MIKIPNLGVMPPVAILVVRRGGIDTVRVDRLPVRLSLQFRAMTRSAMLPVEARSVFKIATIEFVSGGGRGCRPYANPRKRPDHATGTHVFMPDA